MLIVSTMAWRSKHVVVVQPPSEPDAGRHRPAWRQVLFGRPLTTDEEEVEQIGAVGGVPTIGLDALASASYGPEAALTVLLPLGLVGVYYMGPISLAIVAVLLIVYLSYRQTITAYPGGGGSYTVARENFGPRLGLLAATALALDYILNVAVAISAGVGALISAVPALHRHTLALCLGVLVLITLVNLRGVRSAGAAFMAPTVLFVFSLFAVIGVGVARTIASGGHPAPAVAPPPVAAGTVGVVSAWALLHAFSSGCTAMTGVEAVSNGVPAFRRPSTVRARRSLALIVGILIALVLGIALLTRAYGIAATVPDTPGYQSVVSQVVAAVVGRGPLYYVTLASVVAVLMLSANTSFTDFPRLCRLLARDGYLPEQFIHRGRRLAFTYGILSLASVSAVLLVIFGGITNSLIPLFAVGAFGAFTLSQAGMVHHWWRAQGAGSRRGKLLLNAVGASATGLTLVVVLATKFSEGAWISLALVAGMLLVVGVGHRQHVKIERATAAHEPLDVTPERPPIVIVPLRRWNAISEKGLHFALNLSPDVYAVQVLTDNRKHDDLTSLWSELVAAPCERHHRPVPELMLLRSEYRELYAPLLAFIRAMARENPQRYLTVVVAELVQLHWYDRPFYSQTSPLLKSLIVLRGEPRILVVSVPWYWSERRARREDPHRGEVTPVRLPREGKGRHGQHAPRAPHG